MKLTELKYYGKKCLFRELSLLFFVVVVLFLLVVNNYLTFIYQGCTESNSAPLGMKNYVILWSQLTASSSQNGRNASHARLDRVKNFWMPAENDSDPWHQVDFAITLDLLKLKVQGAPNDELFVKTFTVTYANSSGIFQNLTSDGIIKV